MNKVILALAVLWTLGCKKPQPTVEAKAQPKAETHAPGGTPAAMIEAAHVSADKLQAAEDEQKKAMEQMSK